MRIVHKTILNRNVFDSIAILAFQMQWHNCDDRISKAERWLWLWIRIRFRMYPNRSMQMYSLLIWISESIIVLMEADLLMYSFQTSAMAVSLWLFDCWWMKYDIASHQCVVVANRQQQHMDEATGSGESLKCLEHDLTASISHAVLITPEWKNAMLYAVYMFLFMPPVYSYWTGLDWVYGQLCVVGTEKRSH